MRVLGARLFPHDGANLARGNGFRGQAVCQAALRMTAFLMFILGTPGDALGAVEPASLCRNSAELAARESGVPLDILMAISLTETGRKTAEGLQPWPWTVNMEGVGKWFETKQAAMNYVAENFKRGARSFDVGCFQLNFKWHGDAFASVEQMFEPKANALYAATHLRDLYLEKKDWAKAAGAYHSRTPKYATKYIARFTQILTRFSGADLSKFNLKAPGENPAVRKKNPYPLLVAQDDTGHGAGSLFPARSAQRDPFIRTGVGQKMF